MIWRKIPKHRLLKAINLWPPFLGAGIRLTRLDPDFRHARVEMKLNFLSRKISSTQSVKSSQGKRRRSVTSP
jgi:hypothetical protein